MTRLSDAAERAAIQCARASALQKEEGAARTDSRHPYTYASDYLRTKVGAHISRSEASQIRSLIAESLGLDDAYVAERLAKRYHRLTAEDYESCVREALYRAGGSQ